MYDKKLTFNSDGSFRILLLGDVHEKFDITSDTGRAKYLDMVKFHSAAADALKPDLVVYMGDICEVTTEDEDFSKYKAQMNRLTEIFTKRGIPFATIMGNHDHDANLEEPQMQILENMDLCLTKCDDPNITGYSNYYYPIYNKDGKARFNLWFIDSNNLYHDQSVSVYDIVYPDQIEWYEKNATKLREGNNGKPLPAIVFQHIPVIEEYQLLRKARLHEMWKAVRGHSKFRKTWYVLKDKRNGYLAEPPCSPCINCGQFESWKKMGDVKAAFFGHDHMNNIAGEVDGILLGQCKTSDFHAYTDGARPAVRLVTVDEKTQSFDTQVYFFKDFGLKCTCLGPIDQRITDRQSINAEIAVRAVAAGTAFAAICIAGEKIYRLIKK